MQARASPPVRAQAYAGRAGTPVTNRLNLGSLQLRVVRFGFFQDGDIGVSVFPEREEILVGRAGPRAIA